MNILMNTNQQPSQYSILDTSAFFFDISYPGKIMTVPRVVDEIKDIRGKLRLSVLSSQGLFICEPKADSRMSVIEGSKKSGDITVLSETDIDLLALAFEVKGMIFSDDFAIHNTAHQIGIQVKSLMQKQAVERVWKLRCSGCGRYVKEMPHDQLCQICGSVIRRKNK